jgi:preprotein translocase subunit SecD
MEIGKRSMWVSPIASVTCADIHDAQSLKRPNGDEAVDLTFTDEGLSKIRELIAAQHGKLIGVVFDGQLIWAKTARD